MERKKVLIAVKTYPTLSVKYNELVCTAGFLENGEWIRVYPVQFRAMDYGKQYAKFDWIEFDLIKNESDPRKESFKPCSSNFKKVGEINSENWAERKKIVLSNVYNNLSDLIARNKNKELSLAVFKPTKILDFIYEEVEREWDDKKLEIIRKKSLQLNLFEETKIFKEIKKLPYKFSYKFEDASGKESTMMVEDWELGLLYWNCLKNANNNEKIACEKVKEKYLNSFVEKRDLYFFLGTTREFDGWANNPFIIIGVFYPPKQEPSLFGDFLI